ncbi:MAG: hydrogenase maturation nickel metallochaperone HypA [Thermoplasmata archaeon]|nr:hydrogenase maturation nickel metallochaperone HypA [Thermoplasmata archaeon]
MLAQADLRASFSSNERYQHCTFCGKELVVLPNDRRGGACFDCLSLLGADPGQCQECGAEIPSAGRAEECPRCGAPAPIA